MVEEMMSVPPNVRAFASVKQPRLVQVGVADADDVVVVDETVEVVTVLVAIVVVPVPPTILAL